MHVKAERPERVLSAEEERILASATRNLEGVHPTRENGGEKNDVYAIISIGELNCLIVEFFITFRGSPHVIAEEELTAEVLPPDGSMRTELLDSVLAVQKQAA